MTYVPDGRSWNDGKVLAAGWLDGNHPFRVAEPPDGFLDRLAWRCVCKCVNQTRGIHICELCHSESDGWISICHNGEKHVLGSAEIAVETIRVTYAAPDLILHYVAAHKYHPPDDFVEAVMSQDSADSLEGWSLVCGAYLQE